MSRKLYLRTFGCQMNSYDSERMADLLAETEGAELTDAQVIEFVASNVAPYKKVRQVQFIDAIPKSASGKILRKDLRN